jgi:PAS domain-containing protein
MLPCNEARERVIASAEWSQSVWASWIVVRRAEIERALATRRRGALLGPGTPEAEALRRFRSFAASALRRGEVGAPALDGLRVDATAVARLVEDWCYAAGDVAGERNDELLRVLDPLVGRFRSAVLGTELAGVAQRSPRVARRAVGGAIDRIADAFLAVDVDNLAIADANPAAAALLRVERDALVGGDVSTFLSEDAREAWLGALEPLAESAAPRRFRTTLIDARGDTVAVDVHATRVASRDRVLALVVARPI